MTVGVDGVDYKIAICDEFAENASLGEIRKLIKKQVEDTANKRAELERLAAELGCQIVSGGGGSNQLAIAAPIQPPPTTPQPPQIAQDPIRPPTPVNPGPLKAQKNIRQEQPKTEGLNPKEAEAALDRVAKRQASNQNYEPPPPGTTTTRPPLRIPTSVTIKEGGKEIEVQAPVITAQKNQVVEGMQGLPVKIPRNMSSRVGDTTIKIVKTDNKVLQDITKSMDYTGRQFIECIACNGMGLDPIKKQECTRCDGNGIIY